MQSLIRAATMLAFAACVTLPTTSMAAIVGGVAYGGATIENVAWRGHGNYHGGGYYGRHYHRGGYWGGGFPFLGFGAGIVGFGIGSAWANERYYNYNYGRQYVLDDHAARCAATYRSYDIGRDAFLGYDGYWHRCRL